MGKNGEARSHNKAAEDAEIEFEKEFQKYLEFEKARGARRAKITKALETDSSEALPEIGGPQAHGLSDTEYFQKLAGVSSELSKEEKTILWFREMSDEELLEYRSDIFLGIKPAWQSQQVAAELERRNIRPEDWAKPFRGLHKGDCCDGTMLEFVAEGEQVDVCVAEPKFSELDELRGDVICLGKTPLEFPAKIMLIGDGKDAHASYINRNRVPGWMWPLLDARLSTDEETRKLCTALFEQMRQAVTKRPRKKKDGTSRRAIKELSPTSRRTIK